MDPEKLEQKPPEEIAKGKILESLQAVESKIEWKKEFIDRLVLLELNSKANADSRLVEIGITNVLNEIAQSGEKKVKITEENLKEARIAALIHDIGKAGPLRANKEQQAAVARLFGADSLAEEDKGRSIKDVVRNTLLKGKENEYQANLMVMNLAGAGVDISWTMREFWDQHAAWSAEVIREYCGNLSENTKLIAILHHIDKGPEYNFTNKPVEEIDEDVLEKALAVGKLEEYIDAIRQRAIVVIDQYEAYTHRGEKPVGHAEAIAILKEKMKKSKTFSKDALIKLILEIMEKMGKEKIFNGKIA